MLVWFGGQSEAGLTSIARHEPACPECPRHVIVVPRRVGRTDDLVRPVASVRGRGGRSQSRPFSTHSRGRAASVSAEPALVSVTLRRGEGIPPRPCLVTTASSDIRGTPETLGFVGPPSLRASRTGAPHPSGTTETNAADATHDEARASWHLPAHTLQFVFRKAILFSPARCIRTNSPVHTPVSELILKRFETRTGPPSRKAGLVGPWRLTIAAINHRAALVRPVDPPARRTLHGRASACDFRSATVSFASGLSTTSAGMLFHVPPSADSWSSGRADVSRHFYRRRDYAK